MAKRWKHHVAVPADSWLGGEERPARSPLDGPPLAKAAVAVGFLLFTGVVFAEPIWAAARRVPEMSAPKIIALGLASLAAWAFGFWAWAVQRRRVGRAATEWTLEVETQRTNIDRARQLAEAQAAHLRASAYAAQRAADKVTVSPGQVHVDHARGFRVVVPPAPRPAAAPPRRPEERPEITATPETPTVDLARECLRLGRAYAIIGGQQLGKTYVARALAAEWARAGREVWFVGIKACRDEWGPQVRIWGPDWSTVEDALAELAELARDRRERAFARGRTQDYPPVLVVVDDWTEIVHRLGRPAQEFVVSATTMFASCNLVPLFTGHADTAPAWGVGAVGKALTDNFLRVRVVRWRETDRAYGVLLPGEKEGFIDRRQIFPRYGYLPAAIDWPRQDPPSAAPDSEQDAIEIITPAEEHHYRRLADLVLRRGLSNQAAADHARVSRTTIKRAVAWARKRA